MINPVKYNEIKTLIDKKNKLNTYASELIEAKEIESPIKKVEELEIKGMESMKTTSFF
jgi:hypothetical protein